MKLTKIARITWITSLFLILIIILGLVLNYKINYEYLSKKNLYFYECDGNLCMSNTKDNQKLIYSKYECGYDICPTYVKKIKDDYVILKKDKEFILYNYKTATTINSSYEDYEFINTNYLIVTNNKKKGIIDIKGKKITDLIYDEIGVSHDKYLEGYNLNNIIVKKDNLYGIISYRDGSIIEEIKYNDTELNLLLDLINKEQK